LKKQAGVRIGDIALARDVSWPALARLDAAALTLFAAEMRFRGLSARSFLNEMTLLEVFIAVEAAWMLDLSQHSERFGFAAEHYALF
jgi:hypothetical protein